MPYTCCSARARCNSIRTHDCSIRARKWSFRAHGWPMRPQMWTVAVRPGSFRDRCWSIRAQVGPKPAQDLVDPSPTMVHPSLRAVDANSSFVAPRLKLADPSPCVCRPEPDPSCHVASCRERDRWFQDNVLSDATPRKETANDTCVAERRSRKFGPGSVNLFLLRLTEFGLRPTQLGVRSTTEISSDRLTGDPRHLSIATHSGPV